MSREVYKSVAKLATAAGLAFTGLAEQRRSHLAVYSANNSQDLPYLSEALANNRVQSSQAYFYDIPQERPSFLGLPGEALSVHDLHVHLYCESALALLSFMIAIMCFTGAATSGSQRKRN